MPDFIRPNYHAILVDFPVGLLVTGVMVELFSFMYRKHPAREAGRWMILIGALWTVPATTSGLYALWDVASHRNMSLDSWEAITRSGLLDADQWKLLHDHLLWTCIGMGSCLAAALWWLASSDRWRRRLYFPLLLVLVMGLVIGDAGMHHAGNAVFVHHMAVETGSNDADTIHPSYASTVNDDAGTKRAAIDTYLNAMQVHVIFGGFVFSGSLLAIALCIRRTVRFNELLAEHLPDPAGEATLSPALPDRDLMMVAAIRSSPDMSMPPLPRIPSARFGLVALLMTVLTIVVGLYVAGITDWVTFKSDYFHNGLQPRDNVHAILSAALVLLLILLACVARFAPRSGLAVGIFSFLLLLVVAAQFWMGMLILLDGPGGPGIPLTEFQHLQATTTAATAR